MRPILLSVVAVLLSSVVPACSNDPSTGTTHAGIVPACGSGVDPTCPNPSPSYKTDVIPIVEAKCNGCHNGSDGGPWPLGTYEDILHWRGQILGTLLQCTMPPEDGGADHALSADERAAFIGWLACKAPNN